MLARHGEPIAAVATAGGRGAVGIVRASGRDLAALVCAVCGRDLQPRHATLLPFRNASGEVIDTGLALWFPAPHSYTGEDVLELQAHGGPALLQLLLSRVLELGAAQGLRVAEPGEFTQRAFYNGKLDLVQAEAVADLIDATTTAAVLGAQRALAGEMSREVQAAAQQLRELRALVEATLDFPEEDIEFVQAHGVQQRVRELLEALHALLARTRQGALLREGLHVVLAGQPNVGKSSLLNALAGAELAIVTDVAGTTRDRVRESIQIEGVPLHVIDTAGLRETADTVESIGVQRSWESIAQADAVLFLHDLARLPHAEYRAGEARIQQRLSELGVPASRVLHVWNKSDAVAVEAAERGMRELCAQLGLEAQALQGPRIAARQGLGLDEVRRDLLTRCGWQSVPDGVFLARTRHVQALQACGAHLDAASRWLAQAQPALELLAEELRLAHVELMGITGEVSADELLGDIFGRFCIGK
ncbi:MAG: tRNA uridine-5-carboxymethylaminomethyl(34) synthesis GTPase MnmE [Betaproteobacteria bacterium]|nr:tRNA uridine-5-carboxymethylaminomethyl(34) synthesis GTPase MnmE [Betaproteobacteria bacterium]